MTFTANSISSILKSVLQYSQPEERAEQSSARQFIPSKRLCEKDNVVIDMLNSSGHEDVCFCICDPSQKDMPIIFASEGFCKFTGYTHEEIEGRNCRFLQGPETDSRDVDRIRMAIKLEKETSVNLLNYRKDGSTFFNEFFLSPLRDDVKDGKKGEVMYFIGVQCAVDRLGPGQMPSNKGYVHLSPYEDFLFYLFLVAMFLRAF